MVDIKSSPQTTAAATSRGANTLSNAETHGPARAEGTTESLAKAIMNPSSESAFLRNFEALTGIK